MGWFDDATDSVAGGLGDLGSLGGLGVLAADAAGLATGGVLPAALLAYQALQKQGGGDGGDGTTLPSGKTAEELIKELADSESQAGQDALYLRRQAMINNVL